MLYLAQSGISTHQNGYLGKTMSPGRQRTSRLVQGHSAGANSRKDLVWPSVTNEKAGRRAQLLVIQQVDWRLARAVGRHSMFAGHRAVMGMPWLFAATARSVPLAPRWDAVLDVDDRSRIALRAHALLRASRSYIISFPL